LKRVSLGLLLLFAKTLPSQEVGGICKDDTVPSGMVIVSEYFSEQCPPSTSGASADQPNAYAVTKPADGLNACQPPPPTSGLFACEMNSKSNDCGGRPSYRLLTPLACVSSQNRMPGLILEKSACPVISHGGKDGWEAVAFYQNPSCPQTPLEVISRKITPINVPGLHLDTDLTTNLPWRCTGGFLPENAVITAEFNTPNCEKLDPRLANAQLVTFVTPADGYQRIAVCGDSPVPPGFLTVRVAGPSVPAGKTRNGRPLRRSEVYDLLFNMPACGGTGENAKWIFRNTLTAPKAPDDLQGTAQPR
jgi:hypothetical protein